MTGGYVDGVVSSSNRVDVVDVRSGEATSGPSLHHPRNWHAAAASSSSTSLFVFGGDDTASSCEVYDAQTRQ